MRLPLILLLGADALAGGTLATRRDVFEDRYVRAWMPALAASWTGARTTLGARLGVDAVSGATPILTVDAVSAATTFSDVRKQAGVSVDHRVREGTGVGGFVTASVERDFVGVAAGARVERDLFDGMSTVVLGYRAGLDVLGSATDRKLAQRGHSHALDGEWRQILGPTTAARLLVTGAVEACGDAFGCRASPYRYVAVHDEDARVAVPERHPDRLARLAVAGRLSQAVGASAALHAGYRFYADTWAMTGHTADVAWRQQMFGERLLLEGRARGSLQDPASFYAASYPLDPGALAVPGWRSADRELAGLRSVRVGGTAAWTWWNVGPLLRLGATARLDRAWFSPPPGAGLPDRAAWIVGGGLDAEW